MYHTCNALPKTCSTGPQACSIRRIGPQACTLDLKLKPHT